MSGGTEARLRIPGGGGGGDGGGEGKAGEDAISKESQVEANKSNFFAQFPNGYFL